MGMMSAKKGDTVVAVDTHIVLVPVGPALVPTPLPHPFNGILNQKLSSNVRIQNKNAATVGSKAQNTPPHFPTPPGVAFQKPPHNTATIVMSTTNGVRINNKLSARVNDIGKTCFDPVDAPVGKIIAVSTVFT